MKENVIDVVEFSVYDWEVLKGMAVKNQRFELALKCRTMERSHHDYQPPKKKRGRPKGKWMLTMKVNKKKSNLPSSAVITVGLKDPKGKKVDLNKMYKTQTP